ncbi:3'-5' exonuclease [Sporomusa carbonis]|uniref:3'-5' exonuclease n=1 Tax=Sporomusa carbonis TaxID=3076075 RepID=UPI003C7AB12A
MTTVNEGFIAIDFETANYNKHSACQLGIAVVNNQQIIERKSWLIRPPTKVFTFSGLHGITYSMVRDHPTFDEIWLLEVKPYIEHQIVAAHNAEFDISVLTATLAYYRLPIPDFNVVDSLGAARKAWPQLRNHNLSTVAAYLNIELNHHDASSDANACAEIILRAGWENIEIRGVTNAVLPENMNLFDSGC